jgi:hypothetical protein
MIQYDRPFQAKCIKIGSSSRGFIVKKKDFPILKGKEYLIKIIKEVKQ